MEILARNKEREIERWEQKERLKANRIEDFALRTFIMS